MVNLSFDAVTSLLLFLVGVPVLVLQFMSPEIRKVLKVEWKIFGWTAFYLVICLLAISGAIFLVEHRHYTENTTLLVWTYLYAILFGVVSLSSITSLYTYGFREKSIDGLTSKMLKHTAVTGKLDQEQLRQLIEIGKQSSPGPDREMIMNSMQRLVDATCKNANYRGDSLESLIIGIVHILATRPSVEDTSNYQIAAGLLTTILSVKANDGTGMKFVDQFHAVNAMSTLGRTMLAHEDFSMESDYILMDFEEALGLVVSVHPVVLPDVTQALLSMGSVAISNKRYLFAVAALERMLTLIEANKPVAAKPKTELLGLAAHFWVAGGSNRDFIKTRIPRIAELVSDELPNELERASQRLQMTMRFDNADNLCQMANELKLPPSKPRRNKETTH